MAAGDGIDEGDGVMRVPVPEGHRGIDLPDGLEPLRDLIDTDNINWSELPLGADIHVAATDVSSGDESWFRVELVDAEELPNGLQRTLLRISAGDFAFASGDERDPVVLPVGTVFEAGVACDHFPRTVLSMVNLGSMQVGRDYNFFNVMTPDGTFRSEVFVPGVVEVHPTLPEEGYTPPTEAIDGYKEARKARSAERDVAIEEATRYLDTALLQRTAELYDEDDAAKVMEMLGTFHWSARFKLAVMLDWAEEDGILERYIPALERAIDEEFKMMPAGMRGNEAMPIPSVARGYQLFSNELGATHPRPEGSSGGERYVDMAKYG